MAGFVAALQGKLLATSFHPEVDPTTPDSTNSSFFGKLKLFLIVQKMIVRPGCPRSAAAFPATAGDIAFMDTARLLTRGNPIKSAVALLSYLDPRRHIYTAVASDNGISFDGPGDFA